MIFFVIWIIFFSEIMDIYKIAYEKYKKIGINITEIDDIYKTKLKKVKEVYLSDSKNMYRCLLYKGKLYFFDPFKDADNMFELFELYKDYKMSIEQLSILLYGSDIFYYFGNLIDNEIPYICICKDSIIFVKEPYIPEAKEKEQVNEKYWVEKEYPLGYIWKEIWLEYYKADNKGHIKKYGTSKAKIDKEKMMAIVYEYDFKFPECNCFLNKFINKNNNIQLEKADSLFIYNGNLWEPIFK